jgi:AGCS family alanine or glycine:cation symporter
VLQTIVSRIDELLQPIVSPLENLVWNTGVPVGGGETIPFIVIALLGTGVFLTLRLGFIQVRHLGHGFAVATGRYDDPNEPGDVSHFQALTTALSATVGIGNIAGVAIAIHWGGPGALFWMWMTALLGMAVKYSEVTLAQHYRRVEFPDQDPRRWEGSVSGGPMYYIERGIREKWGGNWKWLAVIFAVGLILTSFLTGNGVQANTVADVLLDEFGIAPWISGLFTAGVVAAVILGGIRRIGAVTGILAPLMAAVYVLGALTVILMNLDMVIPTFGLIFREAFNPTAGVAGGGVGIFVVTMMWGVRRGLFSNEAGQGSAPIAHAAAKTDEPVSEGVVALLEPFIDTIVICSMTGLVVLITGVWTARVPTEIDFTSGDLTYLYEGGEAGAETAGTPSEIAIADGLPRLGPDGGAVIGWHETAIDRLYLDPEHTRAFTGTVYPREALARDAEGGAHRALYADAAESGAPLTKLAFTRGLKRFGNWGGLIVAVSVFLFAISTAISWSYYGDRCANYLFGPKAVLPYKILFVIMHFVGAVAPLATIWTIGDIALGFVTFPNLLALLLLSGTVAMLTKKYFATRPWEQNRLDHERWVAEHKKKG